MVFHKFAVGDRVRLLLDKYADSNPQDLHTISRRLPPQANVCQYRVKRVSDGQERAVSEQQLVTASDAAPAGDMHFKAVQAQQDLQRLRNADATLRARAVARRADRGGR
jgi:hypothetical protein